MEAGGLKIAYGNIRRTASQVRGHADEAKNIGSKANADNTSRDLEDNSGGGGWSEVINALRQGLPDIAGDLFKNLPATIARILTDIAEVLENFAAKLKAADDSSTITPSTDATKVTPLTDGTPNPELDSARKMSGQDPPLGRKVYNELSPKAKDLVRKLKQDDGVLDIKPGEVNTRHLAELTKASGTEYGIIQGLDGDLKLIQGDELHTSVPDDLYAQGYRFAVHSHPEDRIPGDFTEIDRQRGLRNSMESDLSSRANGQSTHIEAVVNRLGQVTYFDHTGILSLNGEPMASGPINYLGFVVPFKKR
jgi:hypothetical protein